MFANEEHIDIEVTEGVYQELVSAYADSDKRARKLAIFKVLKHIRSGVPKELAELAQLGRSLWKRRKEILAHFDTERRMVRWRRSMVDSSICRVSRWVSGISITTWCGH